MYGSQRRHNNNERFCKIIHEAALGYKNCSNKVIIYIYQEAPSNRLKELAVQYPFKNFMHLTGTKCKLSEKSSNTLSAKKFFELACLNQLSPNLLIIDDEKTTPLKIEVLNNLKYLLNCDTVRISDAKIVVSRTDLYGHLKLNKAIIGLLQDTNYRMPLTLRNSRTDKFNYKNSKVLCIYEPTENPKNPKIICKTETFDKLTSNNGYTYKTI